MIKKYKHLLLSILLHSLLLLPLVIPQCKGGGFAGGNGKNKGSVAEEDDGKSIKDMPMEVFIAGESVDEFDCKDYFGGIGVSVTHADGRSFIDKVHNGYPAKKAGLQVGDVIVYPRFSQIKGDIGTTFTLIYTRNGEYNKINITRGKICTSEDGKIRYE